MTALQDLIDAGQPIPGGDYYFDSPLVVTGSGLVGAGPQVTRLLYTGAPNPAGAIQVRGGLWGYAAAGFTLVNAATVVGVGIGAGLDPGVSGTQSGSGQWSQVWVQGFDVGLKLGDDAQATATSEHVFDQFRAVNCNAAVQCGQWNTLNLIFNLPGFVDCGAGIISGQAGSIHVTGGTMSRVKGTIFAFQAGGTCSIRGVRAETCGRLLETGTTAARMVIDVSSCSTQNMQNADGIDVLAQWGAALTVRDCLLDGRVRYIPMNETRYPFGVGTVILDNVTTRGPVLLDSSPCKLSWEMRNCAYADAQGQVVRREDGKDEAWPMSRPRPR